MTEKTILLILVSAIVSEAWADTTGNDRSCIDWVVNTLESRLDSGPEETTSQCCTGKIDQMQREIDSLKETIGLLWSTSFAPAEHCLAGVKNRSIPDAALTASTRYPNSACYVIESRLDGGYGWCAARNDNSQWIQVDLGESREITGIVIQGRGDAAQWVTEYTVSYGVDDLVDLTDEGKVKVFLGNTDHKRKVYNRFPHPVTARFVRIHPTAYQDHIAMRFDLTTC